MTDTIELTEIECLKLKLSNAEFLLIKERCQHDYDIAVAKKNKTIEEICMPKLINDRKLEEYMFDLEEGTMTWNDPNKKEDVQEKETEQ